jgi:hypothetical protein
MIEFFGYLEQLQLSQWVRDSGSIWSFPTILLLHTLGMSIVAGGAAMLSLIVLGFWPAVPMKPFARVFPWLWLAFSLNAVTGTLMLLADATIKLTTADFYLKMALVFAGLFLLVRMRRQIFENPQLDLVPLSGNAKMLAWASLACWFGAIISGRLLAYVGPVVEGKVPGAH